MKSMSMLGAVAAGVCLTALSALGDAIDVALARKLNVYGGMPMGTYLHDATMNAVVKADLAADEAWERLATPDEVASCRAQLRAALLAGVGGLPARTPLNARTLETVARDGYVIEKMLFESRPGHYVTALLFLPSDAAFKAPYPGVLVSCGHNLDGKGAPGNQRACVVLAKNGFAALIYDPIDQGEREQFPKANMMSVGGHVNAGLRAHLLGWGAAQFRIWDGIRALDLLADRPEVDATRLGVTGMSGGGTLSAYLNAVDGRFKAACPMGFLTTMRALGERCGPQDCEQILHGQLAYGVNHLSLMLMNGGSALCAGLSYGDAFPYFGSMESFRKACAFRAREGADGKIDRFECPGPHGWYESEKQALALWFRRHLRGEADAWPPDRDALCKLDIGFSYGKVDVGLADTPEGEVLGGKGVMSLPGARSVYHIMMDELERLERDRLPVTPDVVRKVAGMRPPADCTAVAYAESRETQDGVEVTTAVLETPDRMRLPVVAFVPAAVKRAPVLIVGDVVSRTEYAGLVRRNVSEGRPVAVVEVRGFGETGSTRRRTYWAGKGADQEIAAFLSWLGENLVARRAEDILAASSWFAQMNCGARAVLHAEGGAVTAAAHAYFVARERFASFECERPPESWTALVRNPSLAPRFSDLVFGGLRLYDWTDFVADSMPTSGRRP